MSRYRLRFVPQGTIPRNLTIGVQLQPLAPKVVPPPPEAPVPPCVPECTALVASGYSTSSGTAGSVTGEGTITVSGGPFYITVCVNGELCGGALTFTFGGTLVEGVDFIAIGGGTCVSLFGMRGCSSAYSGFVTVQPKLDDVNFCDPMTINFDGTGSECTGEPPPDGCFQDEFGADPTVAGIPFPNSTTSAVPFTDVGTNAGGSPLFWTITQFAGPATTATPTITSGDGTNYVFDVGNGAADDLTGVNFNAASFLDAELTLPYCAAFVFYCEAI